MTERDTRAAEMLSSRLQLSVPARNALFESLLAKRSDQGRLCTSDLLRRCVSPTLWVYTLNL
jgi:hypothetical protein